MDELTQEKLKRLLKYDPNTGLFVRIKTTSSNAKIGMIVGSYDTGGYLHVKINDKLHRLHRLAFLYMEGSFPKDGVDHINRTKDDNRWHNLRHATQLENNNNRKDNLPFPGVTRNKERRKWIAKTSRENGKKHAHLGSFEYYIQAIAARFEWESLNNFNLFDEANNKSIILIGGG